MAKITALGRISRDGDSGLYAAVKKKKSTRPAVLYFKVSITQKRLEKHPETVRKTVYAKLKVLKNTTQNYSTESTSNISIEGMKNPWIREELFLSPYTTPKISGFMKNASG